RPSLPARWMTDTCGSAAASSSATAPVPSGELSSRTTTSTWASTSRTRRPMTGRVSRSLYVGMRTATRSSGGRAVSVNGSVLGGCVRKCAGLGNPNAPGRPGAPDEEQDERGGRDPLGPPTPPVGGGALGAHDRARHPLVGGEQGGLLGDRAVGSDEPRDADRRDVHDRAA